MEAKAVQKYIIASPRKLREVIPMIEVMRPMDTIERLPFSYKRAADPLSKVIKAAIANAKQKGANEDELVFKEIQINEGPRLRRFRAGSRGRAKPYRRRMSHIRVVVTTENAKLQMPNAKKESETAKTQKLNAEIQTKNPKTEKGGTEKVTSKKKTTK